ncbi:FadR/GntR family transcriptional regulator [Haloglycomyces albus]|uniref:FadR/GntR family transcriptional regulator n=1 Tax=Haloglycomyces albus TaxID=526067 RepID=UPI00046CE5EC|nr:FadR/GntR family transcriptional regulator [Haloglycomyces albus]
MAIESARKTGLVDHVIEQLRAQVTSGEWPVGSRIPPETELIDLLGVGRNTLREGVRVLVHSGLLEVQQGSGTFVVSRSEATATVRERIASSHAADTMEVRRGLELEAARLAALRRTDADIVNLREALANREAAFHSRDSEQFVKADIAVHQAVADASHNQLLSDLYRELSESLYETVRAGLGDDFNGPHIDHSKAIEAIVSGDVDAAVAETMAYMRELIDS